MHRPVSLTVSLAAAAALAGAAAAAPAAADPPSALFKTGYDMCRAAPLAALRAAGGQRYRPGTFANRACSWERGDLAAGITLSTHPPEVGAVLMRGFVAQSGRGGLRARSVRIPGASKAVLVTLPASGSRQVSKDLFAAYRQGVIQVDMTAPGSLPDSRLVAVLRLVARS